MKLNDLETSSKVKQFCHELLNKFIEKDYCVSLDDFECSKLTGGLTNILYKCHRRTDSKNGKQYVVRFFGSGKVNDIQEENIIASVIGSMKLGPQIYGIFENDEVKGRIEEFIPSENVSTRDLKNVNEIVARMTARLHKLNMPVDKTGDFLKKTMLIHFDMIEDCKYDKIHETYPDFKEKLLKAYDLTLTILSNTKSPICFCHHDLQPGNTLKPLNSKIGDDNLFFIDYEYSAYSYRAFDAGNYFAEWIYDYNDTKKEGGYGANILDYPSDEEQKNYAKAYLVEAGYKASDEEIEEFILEARQFTLVSHCFWAIWCLVNDNENVEFDYTHYANCRLDHFFKQNEVFLKL